MTALIISFLLGSLAMLLLCFFYRLSCQEEEKARVEALLETARRLHYAKGYQEGSQSTK